MNSHPPTVSSGVPKDVFADIRVIAARQKAIIICILVYLLALAAMFVVPAPMRPLAALAAGIATLVSMIFVFLLAMRVYGIAIGIVLGVLTLIPLIGLFVLLSVNQKATHLLRRAGVHVGLMGARMSDLR